MLTPQEVAKRSFSKASFGGYNMAMVDDFLDEVTKDYEALFNENALLKQKLGVLSGKIREYQSTEEAMRKTLLAAQQMSETMVKDTEAKCAQMLADAESRTASMRQEISQGLNGEARKLQAARESVERFKAQLRAACQQQMDYLDKLDEIAVPAIEAEERSVEKTVEEIEAAVQRSMAAEDADLARQAAPEPEAEAEPVPATASEPAPEVEESSVSLYEQLMAQRGEGEGPDETAPTRRVERKNLDFGKDFRIE